MKNPISQRFWNKVEKTSSCWLWKAGTSRKYGYFKLDGKRKLAHRLLWEYLNGAVPNGLVLDHLCRVESCVNPSHLEVVTQRENVLRGNGVASIHAKKTHCSKGHEYSKENTRIRPWPGGRTCLTCDRQRSKQRYSENKKCQK